MNDDALKQLLQSADAERVSPQPVLPSELLQTAVAHRRRAAQRRAGAVGVAVVALAASVAWLGRRDPTNESNPTALAHNNPTPIAPDAERLNPDDARRELAQLEREAELHLQIVRGLQDRSKANAPRSAPPPLALSGAELVRLEAARSAAMSWQYATLVENEFHDLPAAEREYRRLAERFPGTEWAEMAATSLRRLSAPRATPL